MVSLVPLSGLANGHKSELFFPGTVKSCSRTVESDVRLAENRRLLVPDILFPLAVDPLALPAREASRCAARLPSLITTAVCCFEFVCLRRGSGTKPARSGVATCRSGGSCNLANVLEISESPEAYLSAKYWYCRDGALAPAKTEKAENAGCKGCEFRIHGVCRSLLP